MAIELMTEGIAMSALDWWDDIAERLRDGSPAVFLDYEGTLTPIAEIPSLAVLSDSMRGTLRRLSRHCPVTLVSGRDLHDLRRKIGLDDIIYLGSDGFEVIGPYGNYVEGRGDDFVPSLDRAEDELRYAIGGVRGALVERRRFAVALHHRLVDPVNLPRVKEIFYNTARRRPDLRAVKNKRALELRPDLDWDRGRAVRLVMDTLRLKNTVPLYIGDDTTDEAAFRAIGERGVTILVTEDKQETAAQYVLSSVEEVQQLLEQLIDEFER